MPDSQQMQSFIDFSHQLADAVGEVHRKYFRQPVSTEYKEDSSPVTQCDQESEAVARELIMRHFPQHGILGEEFPPHQPEAEFVWIIDPVDGTKFFMTGHPLFALLLGLSYQGQFILGVIDQAITRERWLGADGFGTFLNGQPVHTRHCASLDQAIIARVGYEWHSAGRDHYIDRVWKASHWAQWGVAPYDYGLLVSGHLDMVITAGPLLHDIAAVEPIVRNAGGLMCDWYGRPLDMNSPNHVLALGNPALLPEVLKVLDFDEVPGGVWDSES